MKRFLSVVLLVMALMILLGSLVAGVYEIYSFKSDYDMLVNSDASGHHFVGLIGAAWIYSGIFLLVAIVGWVLSALSEKMLVWKIPKTIASVAKMLFKVICFVSCLMVFGIIYL